MTGPGARRLHRRVDRRPNACDGYDFQQLVGAFTAVGLDNQEDEMDAKIEKAVTDRRGFLKLAGLGSVAGGATLLSTTKGSQAAVAEPKGRSGYRETDHVKTFYQSARF